MKGVSTVIAIILILMITVALAALAYTWFTGIFATLTASATTATTTATTAMATSFVIESAWNTTLATNNVNVAIRNVGTSGINMPKIIAYVSDIKYTPANLNPATTLNPGDKGTFTLTVTDPKGKTLIVSIETGLQQSATITG